MRPAIAGAFDEPHPRDYLGGNAGAIAALLRLAHSTGDDAWLALARRAAEELAASARRDGAAATWDAAELAGPFGEAPPESATPTGLSHGAGGVALGLFELYAATGDQGLLDLARGALAYEDRFFDRDAGNWRDVRSTAETPSFSTAWCHGAPGIALVRLRAMAVDRERREHHAEQARTALATTAAAVERALAAPRHDATLCHGSCGLAEVLAIGDRLLGETRYAATVGRAAATLVARYGERGDWPSGIPSAGPTPALWLGSAGIGHHLLRLHRPQVPPILLLG
ncbi:MAG: hypothetical protein D6696_20460 [Acidobacteria bacterium]|nr:MAG: hypothetical protein D6696_20460 [Acidobacteriota bacterium]